MLFEVVFMKLLFVGNMSIVLENYPSHDHTFMNIEILQKVINSFSFRAQHSTNSTYKENSNFIYN